MPSACSAPPTDPINDARRYLAEILDDATDADLVTAAVDGLIRLTHVSAPDNPHLAALEQRLARLEPPSIHDVTPAPYRRLG